MRTASSNRLSVVLGIYFILTTHAFSLPSSSPLSRLSDSLRPRWLSILGPSLDAPPSVPPWMDVPPDLMDESGKDETTATSVDALGPHGLADPPRLPIPPAAASEGGGWLNRWLSIGGEGTITIPIRRHHNISIPHRPSAFPTTLLAPLTLPLSGSVIPFTSLLSKNDTTTFPHHPEEEAPESGSSGPGVEIATDTDTFYGHSPTVACLPPLFPSRRYVPPRVPYLIALIERGECDFASKVRAAQERGAAGVIVGDGKLHEDESDEEGRKRENLITMFSPEDTDMIYIPSVFVSRASYLMLRDLLDNVTDSKHGIWIEIGEGKDAGGALSSLLSFALLMPSLFLLATIAIHRIRVARQREADRAPPLLVLSLPERIWTPDIVWEKDSDTESLSPSSPKSTKSPRSPRSPRSPTLPVKDIDLSTAEIDIPPPPPISPSDIPTPPLEPIEPIDLSGPSQAQARKKQRSKSGVSHKKYFSKDECAICMDQFHSGEVVRILPCGHVFHKDECDEWLLKWRKLCPTCRADVTLPPGDTVSGMTITPVSVPMEDGGPDILHRTWRERISIATRRAWEGVTGRGVRLDDTGTATPGERTPLVSPTSSPLRSTEEV